MADWEDFEEVTDNTPVQQGHNWEDFEEVKPEQAQPQPTLTGGVNKNVRTYWDKNGRIHYEDEDEQPRMNWLKRMGRKLQAGLTNANNWINETNPNSEAYKQKANTLLTLETLPIGAGSKATQWGASKLTPFLGKKISQNVAEGAGAGLVGGGVYGGGNALIEGENPIAGTLKGAGAGLAGGGLGGAVLGKGEQLLKGRQLRNAKTTDLSKDEIKNLREQARTYYNDYINGTYIKRDDLGKINFGNAGIDEQVSKGLHNVNALPDLKKQIKTGKYTGTRKDYPRDDIKDFHIIENDLKNKNMEYQIAEDSNGNKYYFAKDISNNKELPPLTGTKIQGRTTPNNIITDTPQNFNPAENNLNNLAANFDKEYPNLLKKGYANPYNLQKGHTYKVNNAGVFEFNGEYNSDNMPLFVSDGANGYQELSPNNLFEDITPTPQQNYTIGAKVPETVKTKAIDKPETFYNENTAKLKQNEIQKELEGSKSAEIKPTYITRHYKNRFWKQNVDDALTKDLKKADDELNSIIDEIVKNPAILKETQTLENFENRLAAKVNGFDDEMQAEYFNKLYEAADRGQNYLNIETDLTKSNAMRTKGELKKSGLAQNADLPPELQNAVKENPPEYQVLHNDDLMLQAQQELANDSEALAHITNKAHEDESQFSALDFEKSRQMLSKLLEEGKTDDAVDLLENVTQKGTKAGQAVQAMSLWSRTTPEGALKFAQKLLNKYNNGAKNSIKSMSAKQIQDITEQAKKLEQLRLLNPNDYESREIQVETAKLMKKVMGVVPKTWQQKYDTYRYINMLLSGKSRNKDFLLTGLNAADTALDETIANGIDFLRSKITGKDRVFSGLHPKEYLQGLGKGFKEGTEDVKLGINTSRSGETGRYGLPRTETFEYKPLKDVDTTGMNKLQSLGAKTNQAFSNLMHPFEKGLNYTIQVPDRMYYEARYASSLADQMKAAGVNTPTDDMIKQATKEAKEAVYQDDSWVSKGGNKIREVLNSPSEMVENFLNMPLNSVPRLGNFTVPFVTTPANIINQGLKNSFGVVPGTAKLMRAASPQEIRDAEMLMAKGIKGAIPLGIGYGIGKGAINSNIGADNNYQENEVTGIRPQSIVIGNHAFSLKDIPQWSIPMAIGRGFSESGIGGAGLNSLKAMGDMSSLKAIGDLVGTVQSGYNQELSGGQIMDNAIRSLGVNALTQNIPLGGMLGEIRNDIDPYSRELYTPDTAQYVKNRVLNRIPFASKTLPLKYNAAGEPVMSNNIQNPFARVLSEDLDFGIRNYTPNETYDYMKNYGNGIKDTDITGKRQVPLNKAKRTVDINGEKHKMDNKEYSQYQRLYGQFRTNLQQELINQRAYDGLDVELTVKDFNEVRKSADAAAKYLMFGAIPKKAPKYMDELLYNTGSYLNAE